LIEELEAETSQWPDPLPRRSGYFGRTVDTLLGLSLRDLQEAL